MKRLNVCLMLAAVASSALFSALFSVSDCGPTAPMPKNGGYEVRDFAFYEGRFVMARIQVPYGKRFDLEKWHVELVNQASQNGYDSLSVELFLAGGTPWPQKAAPLIIPGR